MVNQLGRFTPRVAELTSPLRELLSTKNVWVWGKSQDQSFEAVKQELAKPTVLALYTLEAKTKVCADASNFGLGAVLLQQQQSVWKPVAYASRTMSETEQRCSQIQKEALVLVWACEKFSGYILGKRVHLETDHKPLVPLLSKTHLDRLPPRVLRFRLRLMRFDYSVSHVPGKLLYTADALSHAPVDEVITDEDDTEATVHAIMSLLPASNDHLHECCRQQDADATSSKLKAFCTRGWPKRSEVIGTLSKFWRARGELTVTDGLLLYGTRIVVPEGLR